MNSAFYNAVRETVFGGSLTQPQVNGLNVLLDGWSRYGDGNDLKLAYILGTAFHETARTMQPVRETLASTDAKAKEILTKAWKAGKLKQVKKPYWTEGYFGRGYVQLTHKANYAKAGKELGADLVGNPALAMDPQIAAAILIRGILEGWFTGKKLGSYVNASGADYIEARRVVNGTDRAAEIAKIATSFARAIEAAREADNAKPAPQPIPAEPIRDPKPTPAPAEQPTPRSGVVGWLIFIIVAVASCIAAVGGWIGTMLERIF